MINTFTFKILYLSPVVHTTGNLVELTSGQLVKERERALSDKQVAMIIPSIPSDRRICMENMYGMICT